MTIDYKINTFFLDCRLLVENEQLYERFYPGKLGRYKSMPNSYVSERICSEIREDGIRHRGLNIAFTDILLLLFILFSLIHG